MSVCGLSIVKGISDTVFAISKWPHCILAVARSPKNTSINVLAERIGEGEGVVMVRFILIDAWCRGGGLWFLHCPPKFDKNKDGPHLVALYCFCRDMTYMHFLSESTIAPPTRSSVTRPKSYIYRLFFSM